MPGTLSTFPLSPSFFMLTCTCGGCRHAHKFFQINYFLILLPSIWILNCQVHVSSRLHFYVTGLTDIVVAMRELLKNILLRSDVVTLNYVCKGAMVYHIHWHCHMHFSFSILHVNRLYPKVLSIKFVYEFILIFLYNLRIQHYYWKDML